MYVIADLHGDASAIIKWMNSLESPQQETQEVLTVLGDAGFNYRMDETDILLKDKLQKAIERLSERGIHLNVLFVRGNHECRPENICTYKRTMKYEDTVFIEDEYPNLIFLKDGGIYKVEDESYVVIGGGFSDDFFERLLNGYGIWADQELSEMEFKAILNDSGLPKDFTVLSHVAPAGVSQQIRKTDRISSTERNLQCFLERYDARISRWLLGHYHMERLLYHRNVEFRIFYKSIRSLSSNNFHM